VTDVHPMKTNIANTIIRFTMLFISLSRNVI